MGALRLFLSASCLAVLCGACSDAITACPDPPSQWEVSPSPLVIPVNTAVQVTVTEIYCGGSRRRAAYPVMSVADTTIAVAVNSYRYVAARKVGSTTLSLALDDINVMPLQVPLTVK
jgi:hypothetical protein